MRPIYNFHKVSDLLACSGQPTEDQMTVVATDDFKTVINLGLADGKYALNDEAGLVKNLGMQYHHIPVQFDNPQLSELEEFIRLMNNSDTEKTLVHCAANYRASVFTGLFLFSADKLDEDGLEDFIGNIWQPDPVWQQFLEDGIELVKERR